MAEPHAGDPKPDNHDVLLDELARRWTPAFAARDWPERLALLNEMHEQLLEDLGDFDLYCAVSPAIIRRLIDNVADGAVSSAAQAHIYANSGSDEHRRLAGEWLARHPPGEGP